MFPSPSELLYFLEIADQGNMSRAAERLGVTQPTLTMAIRRLEEALGQKVLIRLKTGVHLTKAGEKLKFESRQLLSQWESLKSSVSHDENIIQGRFTVGCHPSVGIYALPVFLSTLLQEFLNVEISLVHSLSRKITEEVISHKIDFGIVINPVKHPDLVIKTLLEDQVTLWISAKQKYELQDPKSPNAVLLCDADLLQTQHIMRAFTRKGLIFKRTVNSTNLEVITELTASGAGIGVLPTRVAQQNKSKVLKPLPGAPHFEDHLALVFRADSHRTPASQAIIKHILASFKQ